MPYDDKGNYVPPPLPGDEDNPVQVSPNGVPVVKGSRAKAFAGSVGKLAGRALKDMAINSGMQREYDRRNSRYRDDDNNYVDRKQFGGTPESLAGILPNFDWRTFQQRVIPKAGTSQRGKQTGRREAYASGTTTEEGDITMGGTLGWNDQGQGSFAFPELNKEVGASRTQRAAGPAKPLWAQEQKPTQQLALDLDNPEKPQPLWAQKTPMGKRPYQMSIPGTNLPKPPGV